MSFYVNYEQKKIDFSLPKGWNLISAEDKPPISGVADPVQEIRRALDHPIGSPKIEELARPGMDVALLFDDLQRPTPVHLALPEILNRLNRAGIPDNRIECIHFNPRLPPWNSQNWGKRARSRSPGRC